MAFKFAKTRIQAKPPSFFNENNGTNNGAMSPNKLTNAQLNKSAKLFYPGWLKDGTSSCLKQLPAVYHGVLGQVQLQPTLMISDSNKFTSSLGKLVKQHQKTDYLDRFTDTERVRQLLSTSRLSDEHLAAIWAHVNKTFPGQLTNSEVCLALALIAIFQRLLKDGLLDDEGRPTDPKQDPFLLVKQDKKAPLPTLYSNEANHKSPNNPVSRNQASNSVPNDLGALLIDITDNNSKSVEQSTGQALAELSFGEQAVSLLDDDTPIGVHLHKLMSVWLRYMSAMRALFKRTFDILNVESSRTSALEALKSKRGVEFCKNLCLCYPTAHNISSKIEELKNFQGGPKNVRGEKLIDREFATQINDLMISINEYWAVLINLFHECGLTSFVELIMDGLNKENRTSKCNTSAGPLVELNTANKPDLCSLCHTQFYLVNISSSLNRATAIYMREDLDLVLSNELLSEEAEGDEKYFYHVKCANFWLNNVPDNEAGQLPFRASPPPDDGSILRPTTRAVL